TSHAPSRAIAPRGSPFIRSPSAPIYIRQPFAKIARSTQLERKNTMAEANQGNGGTTTQAVQGAEGVQVLLDERDMRTIYSNAYRIHTSAEEVIVDLGFNMPNPNQPAGQQQLLFKVTDRVIMSYTSAKRMMLSMQQLIKRYEQQFGEIPTQPGQRR